jgi:hypothetical protein
MKQPCKEATMSELIDPKYTMPEICRMWAATERLAQMWMWGSSRMSPPDWVAPPSQIEERVRIYMANGVRPEELEAQAADRETRNRILEQPVPETSESFAGFFALLSICCLSVGLLFAWIAGWLR